IDPIGIVGPMTRAKLNALGITPAPQQPDITAPILLRIEPSSALPGSAVSIIGSNFSSQVAIQMGALPGFTGQSANGTAINFTIPASVRPGQYRISVGN